jgi:hypothetical protein
MAKDWEDRQEGDEKGRERNRKVGADYDRPGPASVADWHHRAHAGSHRGDESDIAIDDERGRKGGDRKDDERDDRAQTIADQKENPLSTDRRDKENPWRKRTRRSSSRRSHRWRRKTCDIAARIEILHALSDAAHDVCDLDLADFERLRSSGDRLVRGRRPRFNHSSHPFAPLVAASCRAASKGITFDASNQ